MGQRWIYQREGKEIGPVTSGDLRRIVAAGALGPDDLVRRVDRMRWITAKEIKGLFDEKRLEKARAAPRRAALAKRKRRRRAMRRAAGAATPPPVDTERAAPLWFLHRGGQSYGPYPDEALEQMARSGQVLADDQ